MGDAAWLRRRLGFVSHPHQPFDIGIPLRTNVGDERGSTELACQRGQHCQNIAKGGSGRSTRRNMTTRFARSKAEWCLELRLVGAQVVMV